MCLLGLRAVARLSSTRLPLHDVGGIPAYALVQSTETSGFPKLVRTSPLNSLVSLPLGLPYSPLVNLFINRHSRAYTVNRQCRLAKESRKLRRRRNSKRCPATKARKKKSMAHSLRPCNVAFASFITPRALLVLSELI